MARYEEYVHVEFQYIILNLWAIRDFGRLAVEEKATGAFVGRVGRWYPGGWPAKQVGWAIVRERRGRAHAVEAAAASMEGVVDDLGWMEIIPVIHPENARSKRVAERPGAAELRDEIAIAELGWPGEIWGRTAESWRARKT